MLREWVEASEVDARIADGLRSPDTAKTKVSAQTRNLFYSSLESAIALLATVGIALHLGLRYLAGAPKAASDAPLLAVLALGGAPLVYSLTVKLFRKEFGSDLLAGMSIVTSAVLGEYLAGAIVVLMLAGGRTLESYAVSNASSVLKALAKRMPNLAHRRLAETVRDVPLDDIQLGDSLVVYPHETCPVDGVVVEGHSVMDESYLTGEPFRISKTPGAGVLSGAINGEAALTIRATKLAVDSRYAKIMKVMRAAEQNRPRLRRLGDRLGALYTPLAVLAALAAWAASGDSIRFLSVLVIATPCPLLIAIPVSIIGSISLAAKRGIIVKDPAVLEQVDTCRTIILDKTGTLTYGLPQLSEQLVAPGFDRNTVFSLVASLEQYSKHPLAGALLRAAAEAKLSLHEAAAIAEPPGKGLRGVVLGRQIRVTNRSTLLKEIRTAESALPPLAGGLECMIAIDGVYAATYRFHDEPRRESKPFIAHLGKKHPFEKVMLVSGDRESEAQYLANLVGVSKVYASKSPEEKVAIVRWETRAARTLFLGDGINDAPALMSATVGIAFGQSSDVTAEAAGAVIMEASLAKVDELFHIGRRMRSIALQSAVGGMLLSLLGMLWAAAGRLPPVEGAIAQEIIDIFAVLNALRAALPSKSLTDF